MRSLMLIASVIVIFSFCVEAQVNQLKIIPEPQDLEIQEGAFVLNNDLTIHLDKQFAVALPEVTLLQQIIQHEVSIKVKVLSGKISSFAKGQITIRRDQRFKDPEEYILSIDKNGILITTSERHGLFYAIQTLHQILSFQLTDKNDYKLPTIKIHDQPRFGYRALMLDPARHFLPIKDLKKYIDIMAFYKFNKLHLHLTDDQGWRIEIKQYPKLTEIGSRRKETDGDGKAHEGFYTQEQLRELVAYARTKFIDVIPEVDMPGHSLAVLASYPDLACFPGEFEVRTTPGVAKDLVCAGSEDVYSFYDAIIGELASVFPYPKIHIGGDEAPTDHWEKCSQCQGIIETKDLDGEHDLMAYFFDRINKTLTKHKREPMLWYEENVNTYPKGSTVFLWRLGTAERVIKATRQKGLNLISSPGEYAYFDYPQSSSDKIYAPSWMPVLSLEQAYQFDPGYGLPESKQDHIIGVEGCIWGEGVKDIDKAFYMTFPRALALSEAGWSVMRNRSWQNFSLKIKQHLNFLLERGINYRPPTELYKSD
ncbi:beta-N-acetylhexosaminidase [Fulvivirgaceae bacterium BMA10]|uniref:beta-N-acetylhexosaminidase n=1 Tax=Splendidivirga corallicola TaxID=3051826 RepID=A0ABT8KRI2_9BACT|nr:beta-N-acetylhexosaminidase [Fulvivirgaceae bacterium BMA10]